MEYQVQKLWIDKQPRMKQKWEELLVSQNLRTEKNITYTCGIFEDDTLIATGSLYENIIKCIAIKPEYRGGKVFNILLSHIMNKIIEENYNKMFVYTKTDNLVAFETLGFSLIGKVDDKLLFMEKATFGFKHYLENLATQKKDGVNIAGIVMNANPFTNGHLYLIETALAESDVVHVFVVSENRSIFPTEIRKRLVIEGTSHLSNVYIHDTDNYIVSSQTFPSYFLNEEDDLTKIQATLDAQVFSQSIAPQLNINKRFVGEEPYSLATSIYNDAMRETFDPSIALKIIQRKEIEDTIISASHVRKLLATQSIESVKAFVPPTTYAFLNTKEGLEIIEKLKQSHT